MMMMMMMTLRQSIFFLVLIILAWKGAYSHASLATEHGIHVNLSPGSEGQSQLRELLEILNTSSLHETAKMTQMRTELDSLKTSYSQKVKEVDQLQQNLSYLSVKVNRQQSALDAERRRSAFLETFSGGKMTTPPFGPFKFNHVIFNDGNDYDQILGVYDVPYAGVYSFGVQVFVLPKKDDYPTVDLKVNGLIRNRMSLSTPKTMSERGDGILTSTLFFKLKAGDKVWLEGVIGRVYNIWGQDHSFFSGVFLYPE